MMQNQIMNSVRGLMALLVAMGAVGAVAVSIGMILDQEDYWLVVDTYSIVAFSIIAAICAGLIWKGRSGQT